MLILDLNQILLSNLLMSIKGNPDIIEEGLIRHMVLNSIRSNKTKFTGHGEFVIACDNRNYWRRNVFPYYKARRKTEQDASGIDWNKIFTILGNIKQELKDYFPYVVLDVDTAEADDIIATMAQHITGEKITIISSDKDFLQLQINTDNIEQYDPIRKRFVTIEDPVRFKKEHILKGDAGDGIPNVQSADNTFVSGQRQKVLSKKRMEEYLSYSDEQFKNLNIGSNYFRNKLLIDFDMIPEILKNNIIQSYESQKGAKDRSKLFDYFVKYKLKNLIESIPEF